MSELQTVPVSLLVKKVNAYLQKHVNLSRLQISGELSNVRRVNGHYYFDLKDDQGQISCTMWKSKAYGLDFTPADGLQVLVRGALNVYEKRGTLQLSVESMQQAGLGALFVELEKRRKRLEAQGFFAPEHKKPRPEWIENIAVVTGKGTAALQDVLRTLQTRWPMMKVTLYPASVQGQEAPAQIVKALRRADRGNHDAILLVRGGGSFEDLYCFNDEEIVKTLYDLNTYVVSGVGHEIDTTLADLAADHRAVTPTAAAQWISPDQKEIRNTLASLEYTMKRNLRNLFNSSMQRLIMVQSNPYLQNPLAWLVTRQKSLESLSLSLDHLMIQYRQQVSSRFDQVESLFFERIRQFVSERDQKLNAAHTQLLVHSPRTLLFLKRQQLHYDQDRMNKDIRLLLKNAARALENETELLQAISPQGVLNRGFALLQSEDHMITSLKQVTPGQQVRAILKDGTIITTIEELKYGENDFSAEHDPA